MKVICKRYERDRLNNTKDEVIVILTVYYSTMMHLMNSEVEMMAWTVDLTMRDEMRRKHKEI